MIAIRKRSGSINYNDKLTAVLYELMRDDLTPGRVEQLVMNAEKESNKIKTRKNQTWEYCNGWLAQYAHDLANRLQK